MSAREIEIPLPDTAVGAVSGLLCRPAGAIALLVLGHGAGAGMRHEFMEAMAELLAAQGVATLRYAFPYTQLGRRRPDPPGLLQRCVRAAVETAARRSRGLPLLAGGKSMGGRMTSLACAAEPLPGVRGLIFIGFPLHAAGRASRSRAEHLSDVSLPMLFLQGTRDKLAGLEEIRPVCAGLGPRAKLHVVEGGDHSFKVLKRSGRTDEEARLELVGVIRGWIDQRLA